MPTDASQSPFYRVSLKALAFNSKHELLVVKNGDRWEVPGGGWEHGESMQHCLRRELMEELTVGIRHIDFATMYPYTGPGRKGTMSLKLAVPVVLEDHDFTVGDNIIDYKFVSPQQLAELDMHPAEAGVKIHIDRIWGEHLHPTAGTVQ